MARWKKPLQVGVIGLGIGTSHARTFSAHAATEVRWACDLDGEKLAQAKKAFPGVRTTDRAEELIEDPEISIVSIASYDNYHCEQVLKAIENDKHVFVEKPLCLSRKEARQVRAALAAKPGISLSSNLVLRTCPLFAWLKHSVRNGDLGDVFAIDADYRWGRTEKLTNGWRGELPFYSITYGAAVHMIDLVVWITGRLPVEVAGYGNNIATKDSGFRFHDHASIQMKLDDGAVVRVAASGGIVHPHFHRVSVFGTRQTFEHDLAGAMLYQTDGSRVSSRLVRRDYPGREFRGQVISSFVDSILDPRTRPLVTEKDVFTTMAICFAAEEAVQGGYPVTVEYLPALARGATTEAVAGEKEPRT